MNAKYNTAAGRLTAVRIGGRIRRCEFREITGDGPFDRDVRWDQSRNGIPLCQGDGVAWDYRRWLPYSWERRKLRRHRLVVVGCTS